MYARVGGGGGGAMYVIVLYEEVIVYTDLDTECELSPACWYEALWTSTECDICFAAFLSSSSLPWRPITVATCATYALQHSSHPLHFRGGPSLWQLACGSM